MTLHMPQPGLHLLLGDGHISFGTQADNRSLSDIAEPDNKKPKHFNNRTDLVNDNEITVLYGLKFMQIIVNGETCYFSKKEKYMRSVHFVDMNKAGFELKIGTDRFAEVTIKKMTVEEYDVEPDTIPINNEIRGANVIINKDAKSSFEDCISLLEPKLQEEIKNLTAEREKLGVFKGKQKKEIDAQIEPKSKEVAQIQSRIDSAVGATKNKITPLQNRIDAINDELTKPR